MATIVAQGKALSPAQIRKNRNEEFAKHVQDIINYQKLLGVAREMVAAAKAKNERLKTPTGETFGRRDIKHMESQLEKMQKDLVREHRLASAPIRRAGKKEGTGFRVPQYVSPVLRTFFLGQQGPNGIAPANLGPAYVVNKPPMENYPDEKAWKRSWVVNPVPIGNLVDQLTLLKQGITNSALLTPLFSIYATVNNLADYAQPKDPGSLGVDERITRFFGQSLTPQERSYLEQVLALPEGAPIPPAPTSLDSSKALHLMSLQGSHKTAKHGLQPAFEPKHFGYPDFQILAKFNKRTKNGLLTMKINDVPHMIRNPAGPALSEQEMAHLNTPGIAENLAREQDLVSSTLWTLKNEGKAHLKTKKAHEKEESRRLALRNAGL